MIPYGFASAFGVFGLFVVLMMLVTLVAFLVILGKVLHQWNKNNHSPRLTVPATVVAKRNHTSHHRHANAGDATGAHGYHTTSSTSYFVTFQVESGDRMELMVAGRAYGLMAEGDRGNLTFQGTRFLDFQRQM